MPLSFNSHESDYMHAYIIDIRAHILHYPVSTKIMSYNTYYVSGIAFSYSGSFVGNGRAIATPMRILPIYINRQVYLNMC